MGPYPLYLIVLSHLLWSSLWGYVLVFQETVFSRLFFQGLLFSIFFDNYNVLMIIAPGFIVKILISRIHCSRSHCSRIHYSMAHRSRLNALWFIVPIFIAQASQLIVLGFITLGHLVPGFPNVCKSIQGFITPEHIVLGFNAFGLTVPGFTGSNWSSWLARIAKF